MTIQDRLRDFSYEIDVDDNITMILWDLCDTLGISSSYMSCADKLRACLQAIAEQVDLENKAKYENMTFDKIIDDATYTFITKYDRDLIAYYLRQAYELGLQSRESEPETEEDEEDKKEIDFKYYIKYTLKDNTVIYDTHPCASSSEAMRRHIGKIRAADDLGFIIVDNDTLLNLNQVQTIRVLRSDLNENFSSM